MPKWSTSAVIVSMLYGLWRCWNATAWNFIYSSVSRLVRAYTKLQIALFCLVNWFLFAFHKKQKLLTNHALRARFKGGEFHSFLFDQWSFEFAHCVHLHIYNSYELLYGCTFIGKSKVSIELIYLIDAIHSSRSAHNRQSKLEFHQ